MKKIKVFEIIGDATLAGAPRHLLSLLENFNYKKFSFFVICPPGPLAGEIRSLPRTQKPIDLEIVPMESKIDLGAIREIRANIRKLKPDLIHVHGTRAGVLGRLAAIGLRHPVIYTEHLWTKNYRLPSRLSHGFQIAGLWFLDMFTTLNIAVSQAVKDFMISSQISRSEKIVIVYNATEIPKQKAAIFSSKEAQRFKLGTVGTLNFQKGIQYLIQAMPQILKEFPKTTLEIVGEGDYRRNLERLTKKLKLQKSVSFAGFVKDVENRMKNYDLYVQPSLSESFGLAIIQAMSLGIPIVATNAGGIPEVVTAGKSGILVEPAKPLALVQAIIELLRNPKRAKDMGKLGREEVKIKFNLRDMIKETEQIYEKVAPKRP